MMKWDRVSVGGAVVYVGVALTLLLTLEGENRKDALASLAYVGGGIIAVVGLKASLRRSSAMERAIDEQRQR